jgi:hypothetical protein
MGKQATAKKQQAPAGKAEEPRPRYRSRAKRKQRSGLGKAWDFMMSRTIREHRTWYLGWLVQERRREAATASDRRQTAIKAAAAVGIEEVE